MTNKSGEHTLQSGHASGSNTWSVRTNDAQAARRASQSAIQVRRLADAVDRFTKSVNSGAIKPPK